MSPGFGLHVKVLSLPRCLEGIVIPWEFGIIDYLLQLGRVLPGNDRAGIEHEFFTGLGITPTTGVFRFDCQFSES